MAKRGPLKLTTSGLQEKHVPFDVYHRGRNSKDVGWLEFYTSTNIKGLALVKWDLTYFFELCDENRYSSPWLEVIAMNLSDTLLSKRIELKVLINYFYCFSTKRSEFYESSTLRHSSA